MAKSINFSTPYNGIDRPIALTTFSTPHPKAHYSRTSRKKKQLAGKKTAGRNSNKTPGKDPKKNCQIKNNNGVELKKNEELVRRQPKNEAAN